MAGPLDYEQFFNDVTGMWDRRRGGPRNKRMFASYLEKSIREAQAKPAPAPAKKKVAPKPKPKPSVDPIVQE